MAPLTSQFIQFLHRAGLKRRPIYNEVLGLRVDYADFSGLKLRFSDRSPLISIPKVELDHRSPEEINGTIKGILLQLQIQDRIPLALVEGTSDSLRELANQAPYYVVVLDEEDMNRIMASRSPSDELWQSIRYPVPRSDRSPYEVSAAVTGGQFFGRDYEVRTILSHPKTCYTVIGTRRIGKTSVLQEVKRRMQENDPDGGRYLYYDCMAFETMVDFFERVISDLDPRESTRLIRAGSSYVSFFARFMQRMKSAYKGRIILFLDEIDHLLKFDRDRDHELTRALRASFQEGSCRLISAGFRDAQMELGMVNSPFNFSTILPLGNFAYNQAQELIGEPMDRLGVRIESRDQVTRRILRETAGHPNFVQHYCLALIRQLDEAGERTITPEHLTDVSADEGFRTRILETFVYNTNDLEKAIAFSVSDKEHFTIEDVDTQMKRRRLLLETRDLEDACRKLESLGVLQREAQIYRFSIPILPQLLRERYGGEFLFKKANEHQKLRMKGG